MLAYARFKNAYLVCKKAYAKQLLLSNTISTMVLNGFGDIFCQFIEYKLSEKNDKSKSVEFTNDVDNSNGYVIVGIERPSFFKVYNWHRTGILAFRLYAILSLYLNCS